MESKKINQLATNVSPQTSDLTIIGDPITGVSKKITLLQIANLFSTIGTVTSVGVTETGEALTITGSPITSAGTINIGFAGAASQYIRGDGALADFPTSSGGGSSVSYYLNSSISQGTIGGVAYRELNKEPIIGAGTDITITANGYVASYLTDANDPDVILIPGGNFNCEFYFSVNSDAHNPYVYAELYKYDGTTFTLLGSSQSVPEYLTNGTTISPYYFAIPVPSTALAITDRLAIRIYANVDTREVTLHTENSHLCQVVTTLSKGMVSLNNLTDQSQFLATGTSGTNFAIVSSGDTHTFNLPVASATNTGKLSSTDWSTFNNKASTADLANYLPLTGGTLTGALNGTSALFSSSITSNLSLTINRFSNGDYLALKIENRPITAGNNGVGFIAFYSNKADATTDTFTSGKIYGKFDSNSYNAARITLSTVTGDAIYQDVLTAKDTNVGIGTINPAQTLDLYTTSTTGSGVGTAIQIQSAGTGANQGWVGVNKGTGNGLTFSVQNNSIIFNTDASTKFGGTEKFRISSDNSSFTHPLSIITNDNNFAFNVQLRNNNTGTQALTGLGISDSSNVRKGQVLWIPSNYITTSLQNSFLVSSVTNIPLILCADATGADTPNIIFQSGATNKMLLNGTSGNFSIGNTNDTYKLDVSGTGRFSSTLYIGSSTGFISDAMLVAQINTPPSSDRYFAVNNNGAYGLVMGYTTTSGRARIANISNSPMTLETNNIVALTLAANQAATFSSSVTATSISTSAPSSGTGLYLGWGGSTSNYNGINFQGAFATDMYFGRAISSDDLVIRSSGGETVRFTASGNVGIGTSAPGYKLHIQDSVATTSTILPFGIFGGTKQLLFGFISDGTNITNGRIRTGGNVPLSLGTSSSNDAIYIFNNGNVAIGTTTDAGYKLDVNGTGRFSGNVYVNDNSIFGLRPSTNEYSIQYRDLDFRLIGSSDSGTQRLFSFGYYTSNNIAGTWNSKATINSYTGAATFSGGLVSQGAYTGFQYNSAGTYPAYNTYFGAIGTNFSNANSELDIWNTVGGGFVFRRQTGASTQTALLTIASSGDATFAGDVNLFKSGSNRILYVSKSDGTSTIQLNSNGNSYFNGGSVGIGTSSPSNRLTVQSDDTFNQDTSGQLVLRGTSNTSKLTRMGFDTTNNYGYVQSIEVGVSTRPFVLQPFGGNILMSTTTDTGQRLQVNGITKTNGISLAKTSFTSSTTMTDAYFSWSFGGSPGQTLTLYNSSGHTNMHFIKNESSISLTIAAHSGGVIMGLTSNSGSTSITLGAFKTIQLISFGGSAWYIMYQTT